MIYPDLGFGLGLRSVHYNEIIETKPKVDWFEAITENYMVIGSKPFRYLEKVAEFYPIVLHGVGMGIGNISGVNKDYLKDLKILIDHIKPEWYSDHICFTGKASHNSHDLLPLPYNKDSLMFLVDQIKKVQDYIGMPMLLENPSTYINYNVSNIKEEDFIGEVLEHSEAMLLLDINNIYVNSYNHKFDPYAYINVIDSDKVVQIHMAGHTNYGDYIIDTHDNFVIKEVHNLYRHAISKFGAVASMIEWDENIPSLDVLIKELNTLKEISNTCMEETKDLEGLDV